MHNLVIRNTKTTIYTISDLKAYYEKQLPNIDYTVQEAVGVQREIVKLFHKVLSFT